MTAGPAPSLARVLPFSVGLVLACALTLVASGAPSAPASGRIAVGFVHTCVITRQGGVSCWGINTDGQLGNPSKPRLLTHSTTPVDVVGLPSVSMVTAGDAGSCALTRAGGVKCWGGELHGRTDNLGRTIRVRSPIDVVGLRSGITMIAGGSHHNCALTRAGGAKCWGLNSNGQLGVPTRDPGAKPVVVAGATSGVRAIAAGGYHTCALTRAGGARCWGANLFGQLGSSSTPITGSSIPVDVTGMTSGVREISADLYHTCALTNAGGVKCWGNNDHGELGDGTTNDSRTPIDVVGLTTGVDAIATGTKHSCALTTRGGVQCWGANESGQLGDASKRQSRTPVAVVGLANGVVAVGAGANFTCALIRGGGVKCWGSNHFGQLGNASRRGSTTPVDVQPSSSRDAG